MYVSNMDVPQIFSQALRNNRQSSIDTMPSANMAGSQTSKFMEGFPYVLLKAAAVAGCVVFRTAPGGRPTVAATLCMQRAEDGSRSQILKPSQLTSTAPLATTCPILHFAR
jgi:hypothetical protein